MKKKKDEQIIYENDGEIGSVDVEKKIKEIKEQLKKCNEEKQEYLAGWQREKADFINYRRRQEEKMGEWLKASQAELIKGILPLLDTLETAVISQEPGISNKELGLIKKQLTEILQKHGLEEIKAVGEKFNPELHEAVEQVESDKEEGTIIGEIQKGYLLDGRVLRVAKVKTAK